MNERSDTAPFFAVFGIVGGAIVGTLLTISWRLWDIAESLKVLSGR